MCGIGVLVQGASGVRVDRPRTAEAGVVDEDATRSPPRRSLSFKVSRNGLLHQKWLASSKKSSSIVDDAPRSTTQRLPPWRSAHAALENALRRRGPDHFGQQQFRLPEKRAEGGRASVLSMWEQSMSMREQPCVDVTLMSSVLSMREQPCTDESERIEQIENAIAKGEPAPREQRMQSTAMQPIELTDGGILLFNGEIWSCAAVTNSTSGVAGVLVDDAECRCLLGESDTGWLKRQFDAIIRAWETESGPEPREESAEALEKRLVKFCDRLHGPYALVYFSPLRQRLLCLRDKLGRRSLCAEFDFFDGDVEEDRSVVSDGADSGEPPSDKSPSLVLASVPFTAAAVELDPRRGYVFDLSTFEVFEYTRNQTVWAIEEQRTTCSPFQHEEDQDEQVGASPGRRPTTQTGAPELQKSRSPFPHYVQNETLSQQQEIFEHHLAKATARRIAGLRSIVLPFSGGVDSTVLAALCLLQGKLLSLEKIHLVNVSFKTEDFDAAPDRKTGFASYCDLRRLLEAMNQSVQSAPLDTSSSSTEEPSLDRSSSLDSSACGTDVDGRRATSWSETTSCENHIPSSQSSGNCVPVLELHLVDIDMGSEAADPLRERVLQLLGPTNNHMDYNIGLALYAACGAPVDGASFVSEGRVSCADAVLRHLLAEGGGRVRTYRGRDQVPWKSSNPVYSDKISTTFAQPPYDSGVFAPKRPGDEKRRAILVEKLQASHPEFFRPQSDPKSNQPIPESVDVCGWYLNVEHARADVRRQSTAFDGLTDKNPHLSSSDEDHLHNLALPFPMQLPSNTMLLPLSVTKLALPVGTSWDKLRLGETLVGTNRPSGHDLQEDGSAARASARAVLLGHGADELLGGYARHVTAYERTGTKSGLRDELRKDLARMWERNLGRDDRICADHGREARHPFLDEEFVDFVWTRLAPLPDKLWLRNLARKLGLVACGFEKRAIQFGTRIAQKTNKEVFGSNRAAKGAVVCAYGSGGGATGGSSARTTG